jgi:predicted Zn finger-like uncharacterized protein
MISQCPNCKTRFVVSEAKLDIAAGNVRCGACMQVFCASSNQLAYQRKNIDDQAAKPFAEQSKGQFTEKATEQSSTSASDITHEWLNDLLPEADTSAADNKRIEPSIDSITGFETPPDFKAPPINVADIKVPAIEIALNAKRSLKIGCSA